METVLWRVVELCLNSDEFYVAREFVYDLILTRRDGSTEDCISCVVNRAKLETTRAI